MRDLAEWSPEVVADIAGKLSPEARLVLTCIPIRPHRGTPAYGAHLDEVAEELGMPSEEVRAAITELSRHFGGLKAAVPGEHPCKQFSVPRWAWRAAQAVARAEEPRL